MCLPSFSIPALALTAYLGSQLYSQDGKGSSVWADRVAIVKGALGSAKSIFTKPANVFSEWRGRLCLRADDGTSSPVPRVPNATARSSPLPRARANVWRPRPPRRRRAPARSPGAFYALQAASSLALFLWLFPTNVTPLFPAGLEPAGVYLTRASAVGLALVGEWGGGLWGAWARTHHARC
jgi:hypothetical protein